MRVEIENCQALGIPYLVHHPGAFTTSCADDGCKRIAGAYAELLTRTRGASVVSCLENTAGGGSNMGHDFEELGRLRSLIIAAAGPESAARIGFCFDTCHAHAAGHDRQCGLANIQVLHLNDSKGMLNSRIDRHEHIGKGCIGLRGFAAVVNRPEFQSGHGGSSRARPMILETPKGATDSGTQHDSLNLGRLRRLVTVPTSRSDQTRRRRAPAPVRSRGRVARS
jgi:deoxyribonuclease-4